MSKQDGARARTATDLERKYNFGQSFAEVYGLIRDTQESAESAVKELDAKLDTDEIFNRLTNYGEVQGIYRGDDGGVYINASYIKSGKLAADYIDADSLKVKAANITGTLEATQINTKDLKVLAANITGTLTAGQIDTTSLKVSAANVTGVLTASQIDTSSLSVKAANITGLLSASQIDATNLSVKAANISGKLTASQINTTNLEVSAANIYGTLTAGQIDATDLTVYAANILGELDAGSLELSGLLPLTYYGGTYGYMGVNTSKGGPVLSDDTLSVFFVVTNNAAKMSYEEDNMIWVASGTNGCYSSKTMQVYSDKRMKNSIDYGLDKYEAMFAALKPCVYKYNNEGDDARFRFGFVAQEVMEAAERNDLTENDYSLVGEYDGMYTIGYGEMPAWNTYMIQKLMARVAALEEKLA